MLLLFDAALNMLSGEKMSESVVLVANETDAIDLETNQRAELDWMEAQKSNLAITESLAKAKNLPKISAFATGGYGRPGLNMLSTTFQTYFMGGLQLKVPLSHLYSGSQSGEIQQMKINQMKIDKQKENFLLASNIKAISLKNDIQRLESLLKSDQEMINIREEIRKSSEAQLENGIITASDYLTDFNNEDIARQNMNIHQVQLLQTKENLKLVLGQ